MGSGSSKNRKRLIQASIGQPVKPPKLPGEQTNEGRTTTTCTLGTDSEVENTGEASTKDNLNGRSKLKSIYRDPDLRLLDEILAESEDCLSWQDSTYKVNALKPWSPSANSNLESCLHSQRDVICEPEMLNIVDKLSELQTSSLEFDKFQNQHCALKENCNITVNMPKSSVDIKNNNLPNQYQGLCSNLVESSTSITYNDLEEALIDSIEEEYAQKDVLLPAHEG
ncbi:Hypothetical predicted protein [Pelobates cultripes]|uniref:Uncharacterized protein n=2 Tax=Pelobates cultripes TaxID=61616 RepID=A0AAD1RAT5_PELCU|nr:Hypothetical predicted protein [Pelobates cultripes]